MERLSSQEVDRYSRHIALSEIGEEGQLKLKRAKVLIVGVGGLGSPLSLYLAAAGVGCIGIVDDDVVSESNLQRQILYSVADVGESKVEVAKRKLEALNPHIDIESYNCRLNSANCDDIVSKYDIVVDGCDNLKSRYLMNECCLKHNRVYLFGAICEFSGQVSVFNYEGGPDYTSLFPYSKEAVEMVQPKGVIGVLPGITATIQANEAIKIITGIGKVLSGKLLMIDALNLNFTTIKF